MKLIFLGPPGAGKGTQAESIAQKYGLAHISTGEMLRSEMRAGTPLGLEAKSHMDKGALVPDDLIIRMAKARLEQPDAEGFLLDGFPRTVAQAAALEGITPIDAVVNIDVPAERLAKRLSGRRSCPGCGLTTHINALPSPDANCPKCQKALVQRDDDKHETVMARLDVYKAQTAPLADYYSAKGLLHTVNGDQSVDEVRDEIVAVLGSLV